MADIFSIKCAKCGSPLEFNIITQNYHCAACGCDTPASEITQRAREQYKAFDNEQSIRLSKARNAQPVYSCGSCGASIMIPENELAGKCDFCGTTIAKTEFSGATFPQGIIPFYITKDEAVDMVMKFADQNPDLKEIKESASSIRDNLTGYYLPFQLIKGPIRLDFWHKGQMYTCGGFLEGIFVSQSGKLDNIVLDAAEPYDTSDLAAFDFSYTAGQRVLLPDLSEDKVIDRAVEETGNVYEPFVKATFSGTSHKYKLSDRFEKETSLILNTVYLPMFVMKISSNGKEHLLAVNGQTGRVAYGGNGQTLKSSFGFLKRYKDGALEKEYREFPQYQPKRPLYYQYVREEKGYNVGIHKMRRVVLGYNTVLRAGIYKKNLLTGEYTFSTKFAKYAQGGSGNDNEIYIGENYLEEKKKNQIKTLILAIVIGIIVLPLAIMLFSHVRKAINGDLEITENTSQNSAQSTQENAEYLNSYYIAFFATPYNIKTNKSGKATEANIEFRHLDGQNIKLCYTPSAPRFLPKEFMVYCRLDKPGSKWHIAVDYIFDRSTKREGYKIIKPTPTEQFSLISEENEKVKELLSKYKKHFGIAEDTEYDYTQNNYEPE